MEEQPLFFPRDDHQLFGVLHHPDAPNNQGFVFCHPFAEEKLWAHRVYVNFARQLASRGYTVLRFDYMGHGDSSGEFQDSSVESRLADIGCAVDMLAQKVPALAHIGLVGLRFGATLAALAADQNPMIRPLVLWEPVDKGAAHMKEMIRINLSTQTAVHKKIIYNTDALVSQMKSGASVNVDGYEIKYPLYEQISSIVLSGEKSDFSAPVLIVQINKRDGLGTKRADAVAARYDWAATLDVVEHFFWKEIKAYCTSADNLYTRTLDWIEQNG